eukprot:CAMPEP_0179140142 /NCGR_PEP_ID=MMETSP0796-20121207/67082_1 /TAXON_ID=73915 /ORGANISM="Pyrodinium bahamense, Strain pbaha01" /LENGTH=67 /DNA_ID=CAMNT_0020839653 /DNA_START=21 /DNA_END=221 /DNA_ORIENTATION=-
MCGGDRSPGVQREGTTTPAAPAGAFAGALAMASSCRRDSCRPAEGIEIWRTTSLATAASLCGSATLP